MEEGRLGGRQEQQPRQPEGDGVAGHEHDLGGGRQPGAEVVEHFPLSRDEVAERRHNGEPPDEAGGRLGRGRGDRRPGDERREAGEHDQQGSSGREHDGEDQRRVHGEAIAKARKHGAGIVAVDLSRLLRSESFDKAMNRMAVPTPEEVIALFEVAEGVPFLATIVDPSVPPAELHSRAVKRGMAARGKRGGRPQAIDFPTGLRLIRAMEDDPSQSFAALGRRFGVGKTTVQNFFAKWGYVTSEAWVRRNRESIGKG